METKETGIAKWVESRQIPDDLVPVVAKIYGQESFDKMIKDYEYRTEETKRKISSLIINHIFRYNFVSSGLVNSSPRSMEDLVLAEKVWMPQLKLICSALGVYTISDGVVHKWHRNVDKDISTSLPLSEGNLWWDYLGEQTRIREIGGTIIVMLSNEGVSYLNDIANELSSSYTTE